MTRMPEAVEVEMDVVAGPEGAGRLDTPKGELIWVYPGFPKTFC